MKIAFFEIQDWEEDYFKKALPGHDLFFSREKIDRTQAEHVKDYDVISVFIYSTISADILAQLGTLRMIATRSTGFDHIDLAACAQRNIMVCTVPSYGENTVAEHTFALILALSRNIHKSHVRRLRNDFSIDGLKGFDLKGKTIGVIGAGHIGLHVIKIARGFGMNVIVFDPQQNSFLSEVLEFTYAPLNDLLARSDIITLHAPYNKHTHHIINEENVFTIKRGAILINTARGELVDNDALIMGLDQGILAGTGLDVIDGEDLIKEEKQLLYDREKMESLSELIKDHILLGKENVVYTPHIAFYSNEALQRIADTTAENIRAFADGKPCNAVDRG
ncbi:MAG TPA: hydroxyacid dehydrogenase [Patescibacteria group bacterium]|nr:hydroxyacid dehydrogenase [Patescibacteria group bacterium]